MNSLLICPSRRPAVSLLSARAPLVLTPMLEHLAIRGATHVRLLCADRPDQVRALVGDGAWWGLRVEVVPVPHEFTTAEARARHAAEVTGAWMPPPDDVAVLDRLPGLPDRALFQSYAGWFAALMHWMPRACMPMRIGVREIRPGVWAGLHSHIAPEAELKPPCWIGAHARVEPASVIGPRALIEDRSWIERGAEVCESVVGPETFIGELCELKHAIAWGHTLVNWHDGTTVEVPDPFLIDALGDGWGRTDRGTWLSRLSHAVLRRPWRDRTEAPRVNGHSVKHGETTQGLNASSP
jgi:hypothetical protein